MKSSHALKKIAVWANTSILGASRFGRDLHAYRIANVVLLSKWSSSPQWSSSPAFYDNIKEFLLSSYGIYVYLAIGRSYSIYLNVNIDCPWAFLRQVTNFTGVTNSLADQYGFSIYSRFRSLKL